MKLYLAGPMRGIADFNFPAFFAAASWLRSLGHTVFNPAERDDNTHGEKVWKGNATGDLTVAMKNGFNHRQAMADDSQFICLEADGIALLPGWETSKGARAEKALAECLGLEVLYL